MGLGISTINTTLHCGTLGTEGTKISDSQLCHIKSYPDLGGTPDLLETTDLEDYVQTFCVGVQSQDSINLLCA